MIKTTANIDVATVMTEKFNGLMESIATLEDAYNEIRDVKKYYNELQSTMDKCQEDILHKIELEDVSPYEAIKLTRKLKEIRTVRRKAKDRWDYLKVVGERNLPDLFKVVHAQEKKIETRTYSPRMMPEIFTDERTTKRGGSR